MPFSLSFGRAPQPQHRDDADAAELQPLHVQQSARQPAINDDGPRPVRESWEARFEREALESKALAAKRFPILVVLGLGNLAGWCLFYYARLHPTERVFPSGQVANAFYVGLLLVSVALVVLNIAWWSMELCELVYPCFFCFFVVLCPLVSHLVLDGVIRRYVWSHRCDGQTMQVLLLARDYYESPDVSHTATFYRRDYEYPLFKYLLSDQDPSAIRFQFNRYTVPAAEIPENLAPSLAEIRYDMTASTFSGACPQSAVKDCLQGSFVPGSSFSMTYNTDNATATGAQELREVTRGWLFEPEAPALTLKSVDAAWKLGDVVFKTVFPEPGVCRRMKVCIPHDRLDGAVLAPLGLVFEKLAVYAMKCTAPIL